MSAYTLLFSSIVSRHGIRAPYSPLNITECNEYGKYSDRTDFPTFSDWGMSRETYCSQELTEHGKVAVPRMGEYYASLFDSTDNFELECDKLAVFADDSTRDIQTAKLLLEGMDCASVSVTVANESTPNMMPVLSDHYNELNCPLATEEQVAGLYGGDVDALTDAYSAGIDQLTDVIGMNEFNATICNDVYPNYDADGYTHCTLFETGYEWTGTYYQGDFLSPIAYAGYFAEYFMFQYLSNLTPYAFGSLTGDEIAELYAIHVQNMYYGSNIWNARAYGSQQLGYLLASMESFMAGTPVDGVDQPADTTVLLLVSHDFNNFYLQRLLGFDYFSLGFPQNVATTTGSLRFDLWSDDSGDKYVTVTYTAATPDQQRDATDLTQEAPGIAQVVIPGCGDFYCPYETFKDLVLQAIDLNCVEEPLYSTLSSLSASDDKGGDNNNNDDGHPYEDPFIAVTVLLVLVSLISIYYIFIKKKEVLVEHMTSSTSNSVTAWA